MRDQAAFWDRWAARYARMPVPDGAAYARKLAMTREHFLPQTELFEFGCGTGSTALAHAPHVARVEAIDVSAKMIAIARRKAEEGGIPNVAFSQASILDHAPAAGSVDMVLALSILHLLRERRAAIARAFAMLRPGGLFVSSTPCLSDSLPWIGLVAVPGHALGLLPDLRMIASRDLRRDLVRAGFEIEHSWLPSRRAALFVIARKPGTGAALRRPVEAERAEAAASDDRPTHPGPAKSRAQP